MIGIFIGFLFGIAFVILIIVASDLFVPECMTKLSERICIAITTTICIFTLIGSMICGYTIEKDIRNRSYKQYELNQ